MDKLIHNLYSAYTQLNEQLFNNELPEPIIIIQSNQYLPKSKKTVTGWCTTSPVWEQNINDKKDYKYEINLIAEYLDRGYEGIMETLLHESCHLHNICNHIEDCSSRGKHNEHFKEECDRINLLCEKVPRHGWAKTTLSPHLIEVVNNLEVDKEAFKIYRIVEVKEKKTRNVAPTHKYKCNSCGHEISSKEDELIVICKDCNKEYTQIK